MNLVGACLLSFLAAGGEQTALAPATSEKINEAIIFTVPSLPAKRSYQRIVLASVEEARRLGLSPKELTLVKVRGAAQPRPMQWDERTKEPYFLLPAQAAGESTEVTLIKAESYQAEVNVEHAYMQDQLWMTTLADGVQRRLFAFQHDEILPPGIKPVYRRAGFIHPVLTPSGQVISGSFAPDHAHHHGIWTAWSHTDFQGRHPDFWNVHQETGRVDYEGLGPRWIAADPRRCRRCAGGGAARRRPGGAGGLRPGDGRTPLERRR